MTYRGNYIYRENCAAGPQSSTHSFPVGVQPYSTDFPTQIATLRLTAGVAALVVPIKTELSDNLSETKRAKTR